ncbi:MAG TPA: sigma-54 dependent transcriptional regulator [Candidatus Acidoferrales bacterium]|jgi:transcriptional regulator with PAS, ATPase and Fis domain|nr:sigma-54 dependent transcriptional regulator [Candidatus Acidoferrales bacterium]
MTTVQDSRKIFASSTMRELLEHVDRVASREFAVLITGETGVGKEVIARLVHQRSRRAASPFIDFSCAAIPEQLVESELFGYEQGAFSGALKTKPGLFELAHGGTLFLDEIGDLSKAGQAKLLRVLDGTPYYRLGGTRKVCSDARILAATNQGLEAAVKAGSFRGDLYYRLAEIRLQVPPLRQRLADIAPMAGEFLEQASPGYRLSPDAIRLLEDSPWPGNVRELRNAVIAAALRSPSGVVTAQAFTSAAGLPDPDRAQSLGAMERTLILETLTATAGNRMRAAERLGISRRTLGRKIREYGSPSSSGSGGMSAGLAALDRGIQAFQSSEERTLRQG